MKVRVMGVVQGVGFRPFIYRIATEHGLSGWVANDSEGVEIEVEGRRESLELFLRDILRRQPPLARVEEIESAWITPKGEDRFQIRQSVRSTEREALVPADASTCEDCARELFDPEDRRFLYPFINCTNCGPRYTIIEGIPYDRAMTTMRKFEMCEICRGEYEDPLNRRFHAEPNACADCGPRVELWEKGRKLDGDPIAMCVEKLKQGLIGAIKGLGGFHLAVDATNEEAVRRLRERKHREMKPLAIMCGSVESVREIAQLSGREAEFLCSSEAPIVLLKKRFPNPMAESVAPRSRYFGVMLPYTPLHHLLFYHGAPPLVMTSGNMTDEPICKTNEEALERLADIADFFLLHNRDIFSRCDDPVGWVVEGDARLLRRARGYTPVPMTMAVASPSIIAVGAELKSTICLASGRKSFLSQHIGDLQDARSYRFFLEVIENLKKLLEIEPEVVACDMHPAYLSTRYAKSLELECIEIQHHHAHIVSCMAENQFWEPVIGVAFDGTGYGLDGTVWGGEFLVVEGAEFSRVMHLSPVPLPGGDKAIEQPWRTALAYLWRAFEGEIPELPFLRGVQRSQREFVLGMLQRSVNSPLCSSLGRAFDAVSSMLGLCLETKYEGQPAIELEGIISEESEERYPYRIDGECVVLDEAVRQLAEECYLGVSPEKISARFHNTIVAMTVEACEQIAEERNLRTVALSGGCFQNGYLVEHIVPELKERGFRVLLHRLVPPNDGGVSLGQSVVAGWRMRCV